jgi:2-hydroxy-3-keto-5-methylthiopentenyl-1-phosphate phosphatase
MKENLFNGSRPVEGNSDGRQLMVCDFDRTVCRVDMGNALLKRFAHRWEEIDRSYSTGEVGSRVAYGWLAPLFKANRTQVLEFVLRRERLDPFFRNF